MEERNDYYVYLYYHQKDGVKGEPFYVGKGSGSRCYDKTSSRSDDFLAIVETGDYTWDKIAENLTEHLAFFIEEDTIREIGVDNLLNTEQPEGNYSYNNAPTGEQHHLYGKSRTDEQKKAQRIKQCSIIEIEGVLYNGQVMAAKAYNVSRPAIKYWLVKGIKGAKVIQQAVKKVRPELSGKMAKRNRGYAYFYEGLTYIGGREAGEKLNVSRTTVENWARNPKHSMQRVKFKDLKDE